MTHQARLVLTFPTPEEARIIHHAVKLENEGYVATRVDGRVVVAEATSDDAGGLLHTLDDLLACVSTAESVLENPEGPGRD